MWCPACGVPFSGLCDPCISSLRRIPSRTILGAPSTAAYGHTGAAAQLVRNLKYRRSSGAGAILAAAMRECLPVGASCLVPIPRAWVRRVKYGIDPAASLSMLLSEATGLPVLPALVGPLWWRRRAGQPLAMRHAVGFESRMSAPPGAVIVDDVLTSGATAASAIRALGSPKISVLTATAAGRMEVGTGPDTSPGGGIAKMRQTIRSRSTAVSPPQSVPEFRAFAASSGAVAQFQLREENG